MPDDSSSCKELPKPLRSTVASSRRSSRWRNAAYAGSSRCRARPSPSPHRPMPVDPALEELVARVGAFHITRRGMKGAQRAMEAALASGNVDDDVRATYLEEARRYFESFDSEARAQLRDVDRHLERINQIHFNYTAERGVAVKR